MSTTSRRKSTRIRTARPRRSRRHSASQLRIQFPLLGTPGLHISHLHLLAVIDMFFIFSNFSVNHHGRSINIEIDLYAKTWWWRQLVEQEVKRSRYRVTEEERDLEESSPNDVDLYTRYSVYKALSVISMSVLRRQSPTINSQGEPKPFLESKRPWLAS
jgi:hypothetical protein